MKFDFCIGNPPYQESRETTKDMPVYNDFMDAAYSVAEKVELITPARFLFNAGATPKKWNEKMLTDEHLKILDYEGDSSRVFSNTSINGGLAISYRDEKKNFGPIETFTAFEELNAIANIIKEIPSFVSLNTIMYPYSTYTLSDNLWNDFPERKERVEYIAKNRNKLSKEEKSGELSNLRIITTNIFDLLSDLFFDEKPLDGKEYCEIIGRKNNQRCSMFILRRYINVADNYDKHKVLLSVADGAAGQVGNPIPARIIGSPIIAGPNTGFTQTFLSIGAVDTKYEAEAISKYVCTKFVRATLGILKITQHYPPEKWRFVPVQDFSTNSDIDWNASISDIDMQLYDKYGLSKKEISFIEKYIKEKE